MQELLFVFAELLTLFVGFLPFGQVAGDFREALQLPMRVKERGDQDICPEA